MTGAGHDIDTVPARDGRLSDIVSLARRTRDVGEARSQLQPDQAKLILPTIDAWKQQLRPLRMVEPKLNGSETRKVKRAFLPNAAKMRPDMDEAKAEVWCGAVAAALSDLPVRCILHAMDQAMHNVFEFPTQLEAFIREQGQARMDFELSCIAFLRRLHASMFVTQMELPVDRHAHPLNKEEIRQILTGFAGEMLVRLGVKCGSIDPDLLSQVKAEEGITDEAA